MTISHQPVRWQPDKFTACRIEPGNKARRYTNVTRNRAPAGVFAVAFFLILSGSTHADMVTPALTDGTYRSSEQQVYLPGVLGLSLSAAALPDPAPTVLQTDAAAAESDFRHPPWFDEVAWITGIGTLLYRDSDRDGYHSGFSLSIDADTSMSITDVYLSIDLQRYPGPRERLHTSGNFSLYGRALTDEYQIDIDLLQNYPADRYDLYIELHDTYDHRVLDRVSAADFSNLSGLPLESDDLDRDYDPMPMQPAFLPVNDDIRVQEYAGSTGFFTTLCLSLILWGRRKRRVDRQIQQY